MAGLKLPAAAPKGMSALAWALLAASREGITTGVAVGENKRVLCTDGLRLHAATLKRISVPPGWYRPPGWSGPDWTDADRWPDGAFPTMGDDGVEIVSQGGIAYPSQVYAQARAAIAYAQSTTEPLPLVAITSDLAVRAGHLADAVAMGYGELMPIAAELQLRDGDIHWLRLTGALGTAWVECIPETNCEFSVERFMAWA